MVEVVDDIRVSIFSNARGDVVVLERLLDVFSGIDEVEHERVGLSRMHTIDPRQCLYCFHAVEFFIHIHRVQQRLIKTGLILFGNQ